MALLILGIGFLQNIMNLLLDVLDFLNKYGFSINLGISMGGLFLCSYNVQSYISGVQWLEPQERLKRVIFSRYVEGSVVAMLNIRKDFIPYAWMFGIVHPQDMKIIMLTTFVFPSVCGWKAVDLLSLVSIIDHRLEKKVFRNLLSRSEIMVHGIPKWTQKCSKKSFVVASAMILFFQGAKTIILYILSMTMKMQSFPCLVEGKLDM
jgi:hypothetical protein